MVGERQQVLLTDISADKNHFVAHNKSYHQVLIPKDTVNLSLGMMVTVRIHTATKYSMLATLETDEMFAIVDSETSEDLQVDSAVPHQEAVSSTSKRKISQSHILLVCGGLGAGLIALAGAPRVSTPWAAAVAVGTGICGLIASTRLAKIPIYPSDLGANKTQD
jgi:hypothetical protein